MMAIDRRDQICHFCREPIDRQLIKQQSVARDCSCWVVIRGGLKRKWLGTKYGSRYAHNACAEAAFYKGQVVGQEELWPHI